MKEDKQFEEKAIEIIAQTLKIPSKLINRNSSIKNIPQWDSLGHLNIALEMEKYLNLQLPLDELANISSVNDWIQILKKNK
tara:strand:- start:6 stop:248 length:243 start_codon:yes stop_codon:yes gene_type:complete